MKERRSGKGNKSGGRKRREVPVGIDVTRHLVGLMNRDERRGLAESIGIDTAATAAEVAERVIERLCDTDWLIERTKDLSWLARCALLAATWSSPCPIGALSSSDIAGRDVPHGLIADARDELDRSGLWVQHLGSYEDARVVLPATAAALRRRTAEIVLIEAEGSRGPGYKPPARLLVELLAAIGTVGGRLRKDGSLYVKAAERVEALCPFAEGGTHDIAATLGALARVGLRVGWIEESEADGTLSLCTRAFVADVPSHRDVLSLLVSSAITAVPMLGLGLAALAVGPIYAVMPVRVLDALSVYAFDPRIPGQAEIELREGERDYHALFSLLVMTGALLVIVPDGERLALLHPDVRAALRAEPSVGAISNATVQGNLEVLLPPDCTAGQVLRLASISDLVATDVVDRARLSPRRMQEAVASGVSPESLRAWLQQATPAGELPPNIEHLLHSLERTDDQCTVYPGVPLRLGARMLDALVADPQLGPLVLSTSIDGHVILDTRALPLLTEWARRSSARLRGLGFWDALHRNHRVPLTEGPLDWRPVSARLAALVSELMDPHVPPDVDELTAELAFPPALVTSSKPTDRLPRLRLEGRDVAVPQKGKQSTSDPPPTLELVRAFETIPERYRAFNLAVSIDLRDLLEQARSLGLSVEADIAVRGGRSTTRIVFTPAHLEPPDTPSEVVSYGPEPRVIVFADIRALRIADPRLAPSRGPYRR